jgi:hypothetical protein
VTRQVTGNEHALRKVGETEHGIVVRGARVLATLAPFADELAVYPAAPLPQGADDYALSFCIPMSAPGLKFLCRDSVSTAGSRFDHPLSSRFDEQDAFVIFDDVEVPRDRLFVDCNLKAYNTVMTDELAAERPATDHDPRLGEARLCVGRGVAHGGGDQSRRSRDDAHDRRDLELRRADARRRRDGRGRGAGMAGRNVDLRGLAVARAARHPADLVPAGERDPAPDRLAQHVRHADRRQQMADPDLRR